MKHTRLTATSAAAVIAAGLALGAAAPASAAPAAVERITSTQQLQDVLRTAIAAEETREGTLGESAVGRYVSPQSAPTAEGPASASGAVPC
ncbi:hypothetical protein ABZ114_26525 [Streptomyces albidoflavus]|uniref:hypothetical protein n=1 Tax=Streptomyces TaxID=1883 RepID=UPI00063ECA40|nr:hypothetical protein [Streptomyces sp. KE1]KLI96691.1 hypothetical protein WQ59_27505 [Streptomyces sp. KE1]